MRLKRGNGEAREHQVNIRLTTSELAALDSICFREDRDRAYLAAWFTRWGLRHYQRAGSLVGLQAAKIITATQALVDKEIEQAAAERLALRRAAAAANEGKYGTEHSGKTHRRKKAAVA